MNTTTPHKRPSLPGTTEPLDVRSLCENFTPGTWLDRTQVTVPSFTAIVGTYERTQSVSGGLYCNDIHYFDMRLALRTATSRGRLPDHYIDSQPLGEVIFVPAGHRYHGEGGPGTQRNFFLFLNSDCPDSTVSQGLLRSPARPRDCMNLRSERIKMLLTQICREICAPGIASEFLLEGLGITLQAEVIRLLYHEHQRERGNGGLSPVHMRRIREMVLDEGKALPSLAVIAAECKLSRRHLMRAFREETGKTVGEYIQQLAMERARQLLKDTDQSVSSIAHSIGFSSPAAFSTAFRRATGDSPRTYRNIQQSLMRYTAPTSSMDI